MAETRRAHTSRADALDLLCVGLSFVDVGLAALPSAPVRGQEIWTSAFGVGPGGVANFALAAAALGGRTGLATVVGDDDLGELFLARCQHAGVDCSHVLRAPGWPQPVTAALTWDGDRALVTGGTPPPADAEAALLRELPETRCAITHLDHQTRDWVRRAHQRGVRIVGQVGWDASGRWDLDALADLSRCWAFLPNRDEALALTGAGSVPDAAHALTRRVPVVVVTCGAEGAHVLDTTTGTEALLPAPPAELVDACGAGDMFGAVFALACARGCEVPTAAAVALTAASLGISRHGGAGSAPRLPEVLAAMRAFPATAPHATRAEQALDPHPGATTPRPRPRTTDEGELPCP